MSRASRALAVLLAAAAPAPAHAERWAAPGGAFTVEFPDGDGWKEVDMPASALGSLPPGAALVVRRTGDGRRAAILTTFPGAPQAELSEDVVAGLEDGLFKDKPAQKLSGERVTVQGLPAYRYLARMPNGSWLGGILVMKDRITYHAQAVSADGDPFRDGELAGFLESCRLP